MKKLVFTFLILVLGFVSAFSQTKKDESVNSETIKVRKPEGPDTSYFSPNGDGVNDVFNFSFVNMDTVSIRIFDSKQTVVFKSESNNEAKWDGTDIKGKKVKDGVYYYTMDALGSDNKRYNKKGKINLKR